ncbi:hypothetical protein GCM10011488_34080 [Steroidobacter agaridevorans]|nr:hypothetical protein GCM10011488_34080 [Steroidobacter agaridevorans]
MLLGLTAAVLLFAMMIVTVVDVIGRYFLSRPLPGAFELTEILLALTVFISAPLVCLREEHITVTLLTDRLSARAREIQAIVAATLGCFIFGIVAWQLFEHARRLAAYGDVTLFLRIPKGPLGYAMAACTALAALSLMLVAHERCKSARQLIREAR